MSNLTPDDVDVKFTAVTNKLTEEDTRLWEGLEDEKVSRIAGDEANKQFAQQVQGENQGTESRLSTEVIHRAEGDINNITSLNALAQAMSEYRIKTDLEIANEKLARQQLGVDLNNRVDNFVASWDHDKFLIYQSIQVVQNDVTNKYTDMDVRIKKYEDMLQDITTDSIQITMDNGEINMGAWTILSQAREWDLEILGKFKDYQISTDQDISNALNDIQNNLPVTEDIINKALEALGDSQIIKDLENEIGGLEVTIDGVTKTMMDHRIAVQNEMIDLSKTLGDQVKAETAERVTALQTEAGQRTDDIRKESAVRTEQFKELDDGLTVEIQERIDGDNTSYELIQNLKASNDTNLADVYSKLSVNASDISANASKIDQVTSEVHVAQSDADQALVNAATALSQANTATTATNALANRVDSVDASINTIEGNLANKVEITAFNNLSAEVTRIDGETHTNSQSIVSIQGDIQNMNGTITGQSTAINNLQITQLQHGDTLNQLAQSTTVLQANLNSIGGENLFTGTRDFSTTATSSFQPNYAGFGERYDNPDDLLFGTNTMCISNAGQWSGFYYYDRIITHAPEDMVLSFWASNQSGIPVPLYSIIDGQRYLGTISSSVWQQYSYLIPKGAPLRNSSNQGLVEFNGDSGGRVTYGAVQLQIGKVATRWQPSINEVDKKTSANTTAIQDTNARVDSNGVSINALSQSTTQLSARIDNVKSGGDNLLKKSNVEHLWNPNNPQYPHAQFYMSENWIEGETYTITYCITHAGSSDSSIGVYAGGGQQAVAYQQITGNRKIYTATFVKTAVDINNPLVNFYHINWNSNVNGVATVHWCVMSRGASVGVTNWKPCNQDTVDALANTASSEAFSNLRAQVEYIDGRVTSSANALTILDSKVDNNQANLLNNYYTKVDTNTVIANQITQYKSTLSIGGRNLVRDTKFPSSGIYWVFQNKIVEKISGEYTISFDCVEHSGAPVAGGVGFNRGNGGGGEYNYFWYPILGTGHHVWTGSIDSGDFSHLGIFSNTDVTITNLKVEKGNVATAWSTAPEDLTVGGRNLIRNSDFSDGLNYWSIYAATVTITSDVINGKQTPYVFMREGEGGLYVRDSNTPYVAKAGDIMTSSFYGRGNGLAIVGFDDSFQYVQLTNEWKYYVVTAKRKRTDSIIFYCGGSTHFDLALPKVELASTASQWTPAPEDLQQDILANASAVNSIQTQVTNIDGRVSASASQILTLESSVNVLKYEDIAGNKNITADLTNGSYRTDTWYPLIFGQISTRENKRYRLQTVLQNDSHPSWASHGAGFTVVLDWTTNGNGWGAAPIDRVIKDYTIAFVSDGISPVLGPDQIWTESREFVWLRGGGLYHLSVPKNDPPVTLMPAGETYVAAGGNAVGPIYFNASLVPKSVRQAGEQNTVKIQQTNEVVDGVKAVSTVSVNNNGFMSGYGLISQLVNGIVTSAFGVDADYFYVGKSMSNAKKPFMVLTSPQNIGGVTYPAGVWMDVAVIANATIGTAHIADASITNAKIVDLNAEKITAGIINADRIGANTITAEKLTIGDTTNLWGNQFFKQGAYPINSGGRSGIWNNIPELRGNGYHCWGRDHIAPYSTRIPVKPGDTIVIEFSGGHNSGPAKTVGVGLWYWNKDAGFADLSYPPISAGYIGTIQNGWNKYRTTLVVPNNPNITYAGFFVQIEQAEQEADPMFWTIGDVVIRKAMGGELIVNGAITANKISVTSLSAISANLGTFTSVSADNSKMVITGAKQEMFYPNGNIAGRIGVW